MPEVPVPLVLQLRDLERPTEDINHLIAKGFNALTLSKLISGGVPTTEIQKYLKSFDHDIIQEHITDPIDGPFSAVFHAAKENRFDVMDSLLEYAVDVHVVGLADISLLEYTILWTFWTHENVDKMVELLLSHGANPRCIPEDLWIDYIKTPKAANVEEVFIPKESWNLQIRRRRQILTQVLNLSIRYSLYRASQLKAATKRQQQIAKLCGCPRLLRMPFHLIGQDHALDIVMNKVMAYDVMNRGRPLVLAFAGLSGHGKTELATQLHHLLGADLLNVDISKIANAYGLFGFPRGYVGGEEGSRFNNFLAGRQQQKSVIFLDEFDKTKQEVRSALLTVLETGVTTDLRNETIIDISKSIWILATNKGDNLVTAYFDKYMAEKTDAEKRMVSIEPLQQELSRLFIEQYTPAVAGRVSAFVPFFPFSRNEAAVVSHRFLRKLTNDLRKPIDLDATPPTILGHIYLSLPDDGDLCKHLSETKYMPMRELGARALQNAVDDLADKVYHDYAQIDEEITEDTNAKPFNKYTMQLHPVGDTHDVVVISDGQVNINKNLTGKTAKLGGKTDANGGW